MVLLPLGIKPPTLWLVDDYANNYANSCLHPGDKFNVWLEINVFLEIKSNPSLLQPVGRNDGVKFQDISREEMITLLQEPQRCRHVYV